MGCVVASVLGIVGGQDETQTKRDSSLPVLSEMRLFRSVERESLLLWEEDEIDAQTPIPLVTPTPLSTVSKPITEPDSSSAGVGGVEALIRSYDWGDEEALAIAHCESGDDLYAAPEENLNHRGPFQISYVHKPRYERRGWDWSTATPAQHIEIAYELWLGQGWSPWRFSASCHGVY